MALPRVLPHIARTVVILTDGYVTVEPQVFELVRKNLDSSNFFAFSIGPSPNRYLTEGIATVGRGREFWVPNATFVEGHTADFLRLSLTPLLTDVRVALAPTFHAKELLPVPAILLSERPLVICGKYATPLPRPGQPLFEVTGFTANGSPWSETVFSPSVCPLDHLQRILFRSRTEFLVGHLCSAFQPSAAIPLGASCTLSPHMISLESSDLVQR
jgi:Ca-activated chloride channel family protein